MSVVENFCEIFIEEDIRVIISEYDTFRQKAILKEGLYLELKEGLGEYYNHNKAREEWKNQVYQKFAELVTVCERYKRKGIELERSRELNETLINAFIVDPIDEILKNSEWKLDVKIKYAMIHLLLDVIYSYCDPFRKIHFSAVVCDKIVNMGKMSPEIKDFYGKEAEEDIVAYVLCTIEFICKKEKRDVKGYIQEISNKLTQRFSKEFCGKLLELYREQELEWNCKKSQGVKVVNLAEESYGQTKSYEQRKTSEKEEKTEEKEQKEQKEQKEDRIKYLVIALCAIITAVILLTAGIWIGKSKNTGTKDIAELQTRIEQLEESEQKQSEQIQDLKNSLLNLEMEINMLTTDETGTNENIDGNISENNEETGNSEIENLGIEDTSEKSSESTGLTSKPVQEN